MKNIPTRTLALFIFSLGMIFTACKKTDHSPLKPAVETKRTDRAMINDSELENEIRSELATNEKVKSAELNITAEAVRNEATLSGTVPSEDVRKTAVELAKSAHPGLTVHDEIKVVSSKSGQAGKMTDSELEKKIRSRFATDKKVKAAGLSVTAEVDQNVVTLSGSVASEAVRRKAVELAESAKPGLMVNDNIQVLPQG